jgi:hypothetical protein
MDDANPEKSFERTQNYIKEIQQKLDDYLSLEMYLNKEEKEIFEQLINIFEPKYEKFIDIDRFSIPIIGMISSGKSTFLNFLLGIDYLEFSHDITTKCVTIIRHKPIDIPEIYSVKIIERRKGYYNFVKNEKIDGDPNRLISERNKFIINSKECPNPEDFFILIEARTQLFLGENSKYFNLFQFLDIPGLDEGNQDSDDFRHSKFFKEQILPKITGNSQFSLFLFDAEKYLVKNNAEIYKDYINQYFETKFLNCFFILNKIDILKDKEKEIKYFIDNMIKDKLGVNLSKNYIDFVSATQLTEEKDKDIDFPHYLKYITNKNTEKETNFLIHLINQLKEDYKVEEIDFKKTTSAPLNEELNSINKILKDFENLWRKASFRKFLKPIDYKKYSEIYEKYHKKTNDEKIKKFSDLYDNFNKAFSLALQNFNEITTNKEFQMKIENLEETIEKIPNETKNAINQQKKIINEIYKGLTEKTINHSLDILNRLRPIVDGLYNLGPEFDCFKRLKEDFNILEHFIQKDRKIRIPFLGGYSTGKSSLLNSLIGKDILPIGSNITTNRGIVIRNNEEEKYILYKTKFVPKGDYYCFIEDNIILEAKENNYEIIKNFLIEETKKDVNDFDNLFFILSAPLLLFKNIKVDSSIKNKIELIDFPGIDVGNSIFEVELFNPLIKLSDSFIFINAYNLINNRNNIEMIQKIVNKIEVRKIDFEYNSCLFILTKSDEMDENINLNKIKSEIENILSGEIEKGKIQIDFFKKYHNKQNQNQIQVSKFSNKYFSEYLEIENEIKDFKIFIQNQIKEIKRQAEQQYSDVDNLIMNLSESLDDYISYNFIENNNYIPKPIEIEKYKEQLKEILIENGISENEIEENKEDFRKIIINYIFMFNNPNLNKNFVSSNGNELFEILGKKFIIANQMINNQFIQKSKEQQKDLSEAFKLIHIRITRNITVDIVENRKKMLEKLILINEKYKETSEEIKEIIDKFFNLYYKKIDEMIKELNEGGNINLSKIKSDVKKLYDTYSREFPKLKDNIYKKMELFTDSIVSIVLQSQKEELQLYETDDSFSIGLKGIILFVSLIPCIISGLLSSAIYIILGIGDRIIGYLKSSETILKELKKFKEILGEQEKGFTYSVFSSFSETMDSTTKKVSMIYESGEVVNSIKKEKFEPLYNQFQKILQSGTDIKDSQ